jgi:peptidoglycan hydrolase-like protein with peptidoglycan-binding domain
MQSWFEPSPKQAQARQQPSQPPASQQYANQQTGQQYAANQPLSQDQVRQVQQALDSKGFNPGPTDGRLGPETRQALGQFQKQQGLQQTGAPDGQTLAALGVVGQNTATQTR